MSDLPKMKKRAIDKMFGEVSEAEMAVRLIEASNGIPRPEGMTAAETLDITDPVMRGIVLRMARAAACYLVECLNASERPS